MDARDRAKETVEELRFVEEFKDMVEIIEDAIESAIKAEKLACKIKHNKAKSHHKYCKHTYKKRGDSWTCCCDIIRDYDKFASAIRRRGEENE